MAVELPRPVMRTPEVSVVMSVFNGAGTVAASVSSVLAQQGCAFEFIVVNDGSTDGTAAILDRLALSDARLHVIHQANTGLTRALVRGCAVARGAFIARQDCGDVSLPGRLERQCNFLRAHPPIVMVADAVRLIGPGDEPLGVNARAGMDLHEGLSQLTLRGLRGPPHHGATMFRRAAYEAAGGYRSFFTVAQDIDLWLRLREMGTCIGMKEVGYEARLEAGSISSLRRGEQFRAAQIAIDCARQREKGLSDADYLREQAPIMLVQKRRNEGLDRARFFYFVGSCLRKSDPRAARAYFRDSIHAYPFYVKSLIRLAFLRS